MATSGSPTVTSSKAPNTSWEKECMKNNTGIPELKNRDKDVDFAMGSHPACSH